MSQYNFFVETIHMNGGRAYGLRMMRRIRGLTRQQVCHRANISYSSIGRYEKNKVKYMQGANVEKYAQVFGLSIVEFTYELDAWAEFKNKTEWNGANKENAA
jgi:transcriptional regulator with XRE-family HTH domain